MSEMSEMSVKDRILECLRDKDMGGILEQFQIASRPKATELKEAFETFDRTQSTSLWNFIYTTKREAISLLCAQLITEGTEGGNSGAGSPEAGLVELGHLRAILSAVLAFCQVSKFKPSPLFDLINTSQALLGVTDMSPSLGAVKGLLSKVSEFWWLSNEAGAFYVCMCVCVVRRT
jgi:hypothetical protein